MSAADYIRQFCTRQSVTFTGHPARHSNLLIRALWWKQQAWRAERDLEAIGTSYTDYGHLIDDARDRLLTGIENHDKAIRDAWENRCMSRGYVPETQGVAA